MNKKKTPQYNINFMRQLAVWIVIGLGFVWLYGHFAGSMEKQLTYTVFYSLVEQNKAEPTIVSVKKVDNQIRGEFTPLGQEKAGEGKFRFFSVYIPVEDKEIVPLIRQNVGKFEVEPPKLWGQLIYSLIPIFLLILFFWYMAYRGSQMGSRVWSFGRSRARVVEKEKATKITFRDVAGIDEAKEELQEVIEFLKDPRKFQRLGGRFPKGVLLVGPPGCGKTLLAKAVAGEANVPFFSISGSDFVELFVGVGASRVRDLFEQAKKIAKVEAKGSIIFIDEIDAVGRQRFAGIGGGHDEREQTLNQLLVEMDGFQTEVGIIVMAATNRPDVLDPALLRPGRFDRHIAIPPPDIRGREEILKVHTRKIKLASNVNLQEIARRTPGFSGADLENLCNEAALLAARLNKEAVEQIELEAAIERLAMGPERKSRVISKHEKELTAYHEAGHALLSLLVPGVDPMAKVTIIPRGFAGGYTFSPPREDRWYNSRNELLGKITVALGGRAAEEVFCGDITTGARGDLEEVTRVARQMVCNYGMSDRLGNRTLGKSRGPVFLGRDLVEEKDYSEETARIIDEEVKRIIDECYQRAEKIVQDNSSSLKKLAATLLEKEVLDVQEVKQIIGFDNEDNSPTDRESSAGKEVNT